VCVHNAGRRRGHEGIDIGEAVPQRLQTDDVRAASRTRPAKSSTPVRRVRDDIKARVQRLLADLDR
jgi:hypothetical protein